MEVISETALPKPTRVPSRKRKNTLGKKKGGCTFQTDYHHSKGDIRCKRLKWSKDLHTSFLNAIAKLGVKAVPSAILNEMNVIGLTRENVASHLQKFRLQLNSGKITLEEIISSPPPSNSRGVSIFPQDATTVFYPVVHHPIELTINENPAFFSEYPQSQTVQSGSYLLETSYEPDYAFWSAGSSFQRTQPPQFSQHHQVHDPQLFESTEYYHPGNQYTYNFVETAHTHCSCPSCQPTIQAVGVSY